jgi:hypothetical protein
MPDVIIHPASFRDPSGFMFQSDGKMYRQINRAYAEEYELLSNSGLYKSLADRGYMVSHSESADVKADPDKWYKTILPQQVPYITYPYEWCFAQLKDAALLTLKILKEAVEHGMILKDATPYNIQFLDGRPVFIDTLSFERYDAGKPWVAYRQFCNMFLFPLYLEHYLHADIQKTLAVYHNGIPLDVTSKLLPLKSRTSLGVWLHVYLQHTVTRSTPAIKGNERFSKRKLLNLADHLENTINHLRTRQLRSQWSQYYTETILSADYLDEKEKIFARLLSKAQPKTILDVGANDGYFSKIAATWTSFVIAIDDHSNSINKLYHEVRAKEIKNILPLVIDAANPSPATGFNNIERSSFNDRIKTDMVIALALIHHLAIGRNISLNMLASWFSSMCRWLLIEFVPREDEKVVQMLSSRKDVFEDYTQPSFESIFQTFFIIKEVVQVQGTARTIYLMEKR